MASYIDQFSSLLSQPERMGKDEAITETHKETMLLASVEPNSSLDPTAASLRIKGVKDLTWYYIATALINYYNALQLNSPPLKGSERKIGTSLSDPKYNISGKHRMNLTWKASQSIRRVSGFNQVCFKLRFLWEYRENNG